MYLDFKFQYSCTALHLKLLQNGGCRCWCTVIDGVDSPVFQWYFTPPTTVKTDDSPRQISESPSKVATTGLSRQIFGTHQSSHYLEHPINNFTNIIMAKRYQLHTNQSQLDLYQSNQSISKCRSDL